jgi:hypothetical protein
MTEPSRDRHARVIGEEEMVGILLFDEAKKDLRHV